MATTEQELVPLRELAELAFGNPNCVHLAAARCAETRINLITRHRGRFQQTPTHYVAAEDVERFLGRDSRVLRRHAGSWRLALDWQRRANTRALKQHVADRMHEVRVEAHVAELEREVKDALERHRRRSAWRSR
jgi:hypothetical protein